MGREMRANTIGMTLYWAFAGALMGLGVIAAFSIGIPLVLLGIFLMSYGLAKLQRRGLWAALVGFGAVPNGLLIYHYFATDSTVPFMAGIVGVIVLFFGAIAIAGIIWGVIDTIQSHEAPS